MTTNYKNFLDSTHITEKTKDIVFNSLPETIQKQIKSDYEVNFSFYYLNNNKLVNNNNVLFTFKTKKSFNRLVKQVTLLNTIEQIKRTYTNITIFKTFDKYDINGNGLYNIHVMAVNTCNGTISNISGTIACIMACIDMKAILKNGVLFHYYDIDNIYIMNLLNKHGLNALLGHDMI